MPKLQPHVIMAGEKFKTEYNHTALTMDPTNPRSTQVGIGDQIAGKNGYPKEPEDLSENEIWDLSPDVLNKEESQILNLQLHKTGSELLQVFGTGTFERLNAVRYTGTLGFPNYEDLKVHISSDNAGENLEASYPSVVKTVGGTYAITSFAWIVENKEPFIKSYDGLSDVLYQAGVKIPVDIDLSTAVKYQLLLHYKAAV